MSVPVNDICRISEPWILLVATDRATVVKTYNKPTTMRVMILIKADKNSEAVKRCPNLMPGETEVEIRRIFETEDFGAELTPKLIAQEERLRAESAAKNKGS